MTDNITEHHQHLRDDLSIDQRPAMKTAVGQLQKEFDGVLGPETIGKVPPLLL